MARLWRIRNAGELRSVPVLGRVERRFPELAKPLYRQRGQSVRGNVTRGAERRLSGAEETPGQDGS